MCRQSVEDTYHVPTEARTRRPGRRTLILLLNVALLALASQAAFCRRAAAQQVVAQAPGQVITSQTPTITLDARSLNHVTRLDLPWRFHPGTTVEDTAFASPAFDDSAWPTAKPDQTLASLHIPNLPQPILWTRIHLHIEDASAQQLGILLDDRGPRYRVFANGRPIAETPDFASGHIRNGQAFVIALPPTSAQATAQAQEITLAVEFYVHGVESIQSGYTRLPVSALSIGELNLVAYAADLNRVRHFDGNDLLTFLEAALCLCFAPIAFVLFRNQPDHSEYLWLGLFLLGQSIYSIVGGLNDVGLFTATIPHILLLESTILIGQVWTSLEFVLSFAGVRRSVSIRVLEIALILAPLCAFINFKAISIAFVVCLSAWTVCVVTSLILGYRRGRTECGLLLLPLSAMVGAFSLLYTNSLLRLQLPFRTSWAIGPIQFDIGDLSLLALLASLIGLILLRFIRTTREEQRALGELEAARTVQQVLVPEEIPAIPGYQVATLYRAAQQVGGDFFQIVPLAGRTPDSDGDVLIVAGDVTGKGLQAGMLVALLVGAIRASADANPDPLAVLQSLNRRLLGRGASQATCLAMQVTPAGDVTLANAGHIPPYLNGEPIDMQGALPLGMIEEADFSVMHFHLEPNDHLVVISDGILEATSPTGELFGFDRTAGMLKARLSIEDLADAAQRFGQQDDISLVAVTRGCYEVAIRISLVVMRIANAMKCIPLSV